MKHYRHSIVKSVPRRCGPLSLVLSDLAYQLGEVSKRLSSIDSLESSLLRSFSSVLDSMYHHYRSIGK